MRSSAVEKKLQTAMCVASHGTEFLGLWGKDSQPLACMVLDHSSVMVGQSSFWAEGQRMSVNSGSDEVGGPGNEFM